MPAIGIALATSLPYFQGKQPCLAATTANVTLAGGAPSTSDGVTLAANDRVLVKSQTAPAENGIYVVSTLGSGANGTWTRATDMNTWLQVPNAYTFVEQGTLYGDTGWLCTSDPGGTIGVTAITWYQFAGAGAYTAGTGLTLTGTQFSLTAPVTVALGGTNATSASITAFNNITGYTAAGATGTTSTNLVFSTSPTLVTPVLGAATGTSLALSGLATVGTTLTVTGGAAFSFSTLTDAATVAVNLATSTNFNLTLGGNRTLGTPTNPVPGQSGVITVRQDITGSRTLAYAWPYMFVGGAAPTLSTGKLVMDQLNYMVNSYSTSTVTVTIATPAVMTWTAHGLNSGQRIQLTTTGALPTGLTASTTYLVTVIDANTFNLSTSLANAQAATFIATSGSQSGTHTAVNFGITLTLNPAIA